jgi:large subunit ribosomal protein L13
MRFGGKVVGTPGWEEMARVVREADTKARI